MGEQTHLFFRARFHYQTTGRTIKAPLRDKIPGGAFLYSPISAALGETVAVGGLDRSSYPADSPRGRAADGALSRDAIGAQRLSALFSYAAARRAHRSWAADANLLHRLRTRDGAGRGARRGNSRG